MHSVWNDTGSGVRVIRVGSNEDKAHEALFLGHLLALFRSVAAEEEWSPGDALERAQNSASVYFALESGNGQILGGLQLTVPDNQGTLPCVEVWPESRNFVQAAVGARAAHIGVLALAPEIRGEGLLFWRLAVEMWRYCVESNITTLFIEVTPRVLPIYRRLGWPLMIRGELRQHWGEPCYLCTLGIPEVAEVLLRRAERSRYYREIVSQAFRITITPVDVPSSHQATRLHEHSPVYAYQSVM